MRSSSLGPQPCYGRTAAVTEAFATNSQDADLVLVEEEQVTGIDSITAQTGTVERARLAFKRTVHLSGAELYKVEVAYYCM